MTGSRRRVAPAAHASEAGKVGRISWTDKRAAVARLRALSGGAEHPLGSHVRVVADHYGVSARSVYRWLQDPSLTDPEATSTPPARFEVTLDHLVAVAQEQNAHDAHERLTKAGAISCSYATFARALRERTDPGLVAAALDGHNGLVNNRLHLAYNPPHRNHTWHLDHTPMDLWVWPSHKQRLPIRPQVTAVVDGATGLVLAMVPWKTDVDQEMVAAALAEAAVLRDYEGVLVGGVPEQIICDNAAQHFAPVMREAAERLGWIIAPTAAYSSWQNGKAERVMGLINQKFADRMPGASKAGTNRNGSPRFVERLPRHVKPEEVLSWEAFRALLEAYRLDLNRKVQVRRLGKQTRLQAWAADPTELRLLDPDIRAPPCSRRPP
jgi:transposase